MTESVLKRSNPILIKPNILLQGNECVEFVLVDHEPMSISSMPMACVSSIWIHSSFSIRLRFIFFYYCKYEWVFRHKDKTSYSAQTNVLLKLPNEFQSRSLYVNYHFSWIASNDLHFMFLQFWSNVFPQMLSVANLLLFFLFSVSVQESGCTFRECAALTPVPDEFQSRSLSLYVSCQLSLALMTFISFPASYDCI